MESTLPGAPRPRPSLSIAEGDGGRTLLHCFAGCTPEKIVAAMGLTMRDLFPDAAPQAERRLVATYDYCDENGILLFQKLRYDPKDFGVRRHDGKGGWRYNIDGVRPVLYRLPELTTADVRETVYIVEREKDVERLRMRGFIATTSPFGASKTPSTKKWLPEFNEKFRNRKVVVIPDAEETGVEYAWHIAEQILPFAADVRIVELPGARLHDDVGDFFERGGTREQLLELVEKEGKIDGLRLQ